MDTHQRPRKGSGAGPFQEASKVRVAEERANQRPTGCILSCSTISNRAGGKKYTRTPTWHQSGGGDNCPMISTHLLMLERQQGRQPGHVAPIKVRQHRRSSRRH
ncbi:hypothetical protein Hanom_Chr02g00107091 [Helianthus anomalus]